MRDLLIQAIGFAGVAFYVASYQIKSNKALFACQLTGCALFCLQFFLLGAFTGALSLIINALSHMLLIKIDDWPWVRSKVTLGVIIALLVVVSIFTWDGWISLLPLASVTATRIGYWTDNAQKIRLSQFIGSPLVLVYDALIRSWGGVLNESITLLSIIVSVIRFGWKNMDDPDSGF